MLRLSICKRALEYRLDSKRDANSFVSLIVFPDHNMPSAELRRSSSSNSVSKQVTSSSDINSSLTLRFCLISFFILTFLKELNASFRCSKYEAGFVLLFERSELTLKLRSVWGQTGSTFTTILRIFLNVICAAELILDRCPA